MVDNFIDRKHGREEISYPDSTWQHDSLQPILEPTYGVILYQEQVMQIAQVLAGYTLGGADMLRRAMGKKKPEEMAKQRSVFKAGAESQGVDGELAMKIFDLVEKFAGYGFNKSHSAAYALVSYQTLWMKAHYPAEFMAAVMSADMDNTEKIVTLVDECERMKLPLNPPDVNSGRYKFTVNDAGEVVYGIGAVKGVGEGPVEAILAARDEHGEFKDLFDFCAKVDLKKVNKRVLEKLIYAGAFDKLGPHRASMMATLPEAIKAAEQHVKAQALGQGDMFGLIACEEHDVQQEFKEVQPWPDKVWLEGERENLGLYLTGHPINQYRKEIKHYTNVRLVDIAPTERDGSVTVCGLVLGVRVMINKKGNKWGLVTIDDKSARLEIRFFPQDFETFQEVLQKDKILLVSGQVRFDDYSGGLTMTGRDVMDLMTAREKYVTGLKIQLDAQKLDNDFVTRFEQVLSPFKEGTCPLNISYQTAEAQADLTLGLQWRVSPSDDLLYQLQPLVENVELQFN
jgi:DNA polymerase-3 subunit alpha